METEGVVDYRGMICPEPYIRALRLLEKTPRGKPVKILMDSWRCVFLLAETAKSLGIRVEVEKSGDAYLVTLVR